MQKALLIIYARVVFIVFDFSKTRLAHPSYKISVTHIRRTISTFFICKIAICHYSTYKMLRNVNANKAPTPPWGLRGVYALPCSLTRRFNTPTGSRGRASQRRPAQRPHLGNKRSGFAYSAVVHSPCGLDKPCVLS